MQPINKFFYHQFSEGDTQEMISFISRFAETLNAQDATIEQLSGWILKGIEIFKAGTYRDFTYTDEHLDEMVNNFKALKDKTLFDPVFKKDHSESIDAQVGWIHNVYREGDLLKADIHLTDWHTMEKIREGTWRNLSSEIYPPELAAEEFGNDVTGHVLRGVAIVSVPKVKGLKGLILNSEILENQEEGNEVNKEQLLAMLAKHGIQFSEQEAAELTMEQLEEKLTAKFAELQKPEGQQDPAPAQFSEGQVVTFTATEFVNLSKKFSEMETQVESFSETIKQLKGESKKAGIEKKISALMKAGKVTPAEQEEIMSFAELLDEQAADKYFETLNKRTPVVEFGEGGTHQQADEDAEVDAALAALRSNKTYE